MKKSTYYEIIKKENIDKYKELKQRIKEIYEENKHVYGYRRIREQLKKEGYKISRKLTLKLMQELGIKGNRSNKSKYNSYKGDIGKTAENLLNRDFKADKANEKWVTDISEFRIGGLKLYLSPLIDLYNDEVISYELTKSPTIEVVRKMVEKGISRLKEGEQYQYYITATNGVVYNNSSGNPSLVKSILDGGANWWYLRSPTFYSNFYFCSIVSNGNANDGAANSSNGGVSFGFSV